MKAHTQGYIIMKAHTHEMIRYDNERNLILLV